jgi:hypothetical protein
MYRHFNPVIGTIVGKGKKGYILGYIFQKRVKTRYRCRKPCRTLSPMERSSFSVPTFFYLLVILRLRYLQLTPHFLSKNIPPWNMVRSSKGGSFFPARKSARRQWNSRFVRTTCSNTIYLSGKSVEACAWLDAIPKSEAQTLSPSEFRTAFRNRLLIPHSQLLAHTTCTCGKDVDC